MRREVLRTFHSPSQRARWSRLQVHRVAAKQLFDPISALDRWKKVRYHSGEQLNGAGRRRRQRLRRHVGMIFQGHSLLKCLTAEETPDV